MQPPKPLPDHVVHADWGSEPGKCWMARAVRAGGSYRAQAPEHAGPPATLLARLREAAGTKGCVLLGFDFPIGVPAAYGRLAEVEGFLDLLVRLGREPWAGFFDIARKRDQISLRRPFYPFKPGGTRQRHLLDGLGLDAKEDLLRVCERKNATRRQACALFWTLGANQAGRAALSGWRDVLMPGLRDGAVALSVWPFHGALAGLFGPDRVVVAETYPAEFYTHLGVAFPRGQAKVKSGKRVQGDRKANARVLRQQAERLGVSLDPALRQRIDDGFGPTQGGEDPFDAFVGLLGMLNVLLGGRPLWEPDADGIRTVEGWILGQQCVHPPEPTGVAQ